MGPVQVLSYLVYQCCQPLSLFVVGGTYACGETVSTSSAGTLVTKVFTSFALIFF